MQSIFYPVHGRACQLIACGFPNHTFLYRSPVSLSACPARLTLLGLNFKTRGTMLLELRIIQFSSFSSHSCPRSNVCDELLAFLVRIPEAEASNGGLHTCYCAVFAVPVSSSRQRPSEFPQLSHARSFPHPSHVY